MPSKHICVAASASQARAPLPPVRTFAAAPQSQTRAPPLPPIRIYVAAPTRPYTVEVEDTPASRAPLLPPSPYQIAKRGPHRTPSPTILVHIRRTCTVATPAQAQYHPKLDTQRRCNSIHEVQTTRQPGDLQAQRQGPPYSLDCQDSSTGTT